MLVPPRREPDVTFPMALFYVQRPSAIDRPVRTGLRPEADDIAQPGAHCISRVSISESAEFHPWLPPSPTRSEPCGAIAGILSMWGLSGPPPEAVALLKGRWLEGAFL